MLSLCRLNVQLVCELVYGLVCELVCEWYAIIDMCIRRSSNNIIDTFALQNSPHSYLHFQLCDFLMKYRHSEVYR